MIIKSIVSTIEFFGGEIFVKAEVEKIVLEKGKAVGVALKSGDFLQSENVISSIGL